MIRPTAAITTRLGTGTDHLVVIVAIFVVATLVMLARSGSFGAGLDRRPVDGPPAGR